MLAFSFYREIHSFNLTKLHNALLWFCKSQAMSFPTAVFKSALCLTLLKKEPFKNSFASKHHQSFVCLQVRFGLGCYLAKTAKYALQGYYFWTAGKHEDTEDPSLTSCETDQSSNQGKHFYHAMCTTQVQQKLNSVQNRLESWQNLLLLQKRNDTFTAMQHVHTRVYWKERYLTMKPSHQNKTRV